MSMSEGEIAALISEHLASKNERDDSYMTKRELRRVAAAGGFTRSHRWWDVRVRDFVEEGLIETKIESRVSPISGKATSVPVYRFVPVYKIKGE